MRVMLGPLLAAVVLVGFKSVELVAQAPSAVQQASDLARELMSPFCPGKLLAECTSPSAGELREEMARRIAAGESADAVKDDLVKQYGAEILGAPPAAGLGLLVWILPAALGLGTAAGVGWKVLRAGRDGQALAGASLAAAGGADAATLARVEDELRDLD